MKTVVSFLLLGLWAVVLLAGVAVYAMHGESPVLARYMESALERRLDGVSCVIRTAEPAFWPAPGLRLNGLLLRDARGDTLFADVCTVKLSWKSLLQGDFVPGSVELTGPLVRVERQTGPSFLSVKDQLAALALRFRSEKNAGKTADPASRPSDTSPDLSTNASPPPTSGRVPDWFSGMRVAIRNGQVQWRQGETRFAAAGINLSCSLPVALSDSFTLLDGKADLSVAALEQRQGEQTVFSLRDLRLEIGDLQLPASTPPSGRAVMSVLADVEGIARQTRVRLELVLDTSDNAVSAEGSLLLDGEAMLNGHPTPMTLSLPFASPDLAGSIRFPDSRLTLERDEASFDAEFSLQPSPLLRGTLRAEHLSLPRWFGFARELPPSLQYALDDLKGRLRFELTPTALKVPDLEAVLLGARFTGSAGVDNLARPVIRLEAATPEFDGNDLFPELKTEARKAPSFTAPPAVPSTPPGPDDVGYDIRLSAAKASVWDYAGEGLVFSLKPLPKGSALTVSFASLYGGTCRAALDIEDDFALKFQCNGVSGEELSRRGGASRPFGGRLSAEADLKALGSTPQQLLTRFSGSIRMSLDNGFLTGMKKGRAERWPFARLETVFTGKGIGLAPDAPNQAIYDGRWQIVLRRPSLDAHAELNGPVRFSTRTLLPEQVSHLPARASGVLAGNNGELSGLFSYASGNESLELSEARGSWGGVRFSGNIAGRRLDTAPVWEGSLSAEASPLRVALENLGLGGFVKSVTAKDTLRSGRVSTHFICSDSEIRLTELTGFFDDTTFKGSLSRTSGRPPLWRADLRLGSLNVDRYMTEGPKSSVPWPRDALTSFEFQGRVRLDTLILADVAQQNVDIPLSVRKGTLEAAPVKALIYGGMSTGSLRAETLPHGFLISLTYALRNTDLLKISMSRKQESLIGGWGSFGVKIKGLLSSTADIPAALNGTWDLRIDKGWLASNETAPRRTFQRLSASGSLQNGVLISDDLRVGGDSFTVKGSGRINLVDWTINYRLMVSTLGVSDIPVTYSGSLSDPQRRINALGVVAGVLGSIGRGVFNLIDNVVSTPFKLLHR